MNRFIVNIHASYQSWNWAVIWCLYSKIQEINKDGHELLVFEDIVRKDKSRAKNWTIRTEYTEDINSATKLKPKK